MVDPNNSGNNGGNGNDWVEDVKSEVSGMAKEGMHHPSTKPVLTGAAVGSSLQRAGPAMQTCRACARRARLRRSRSGVSNNTLAAGRPGSRAR